MRRRAREAWEPTGWDQSGSGRPLSGCEHGQRWATRRCNDRSGGWTIAAKVAYLAYWEGRDVAERRQDATRAIMRTRR